MNLTRRQGVNGCFAPALSGGASQVIRNVGRTSSSAGDGGGGGRLALPPGRIRSGLLLPCAEQAVPQ
jgi:hypothetical protein